MRSTLHNPTAKAVFGASELPALGEPIDDHETNVVARVGVLTAGISQPDDQPVGRGATTEGAQELLL